MARIKFLVALLALLICAAGMGGAFYYWKKFVEPEMVLNRHMEGGEGAREKPDLGKRHFDQAVELLKDGELVSARDRLLYLMEYFPESKTFHEAKRIVGEVNLDLLLSNIPQPEKAIHKVRRGEALVTIARRNETTIDYIMRTNGKSTSLIYPDEELLVRPLNYRVEIDLENSLLTVFDEEAFFKEYEILGKNLPPEVGPPISTTINEKVAWHMDRPLNFTDANYLNCSKWIRTGKIGLFIREQNPDDEDGESRSFGVMVSKSDLEELFTILRNGSQVNVVN